MISWIICDLDGTLLKHNKDKLFANSNTIKLINKLKLNNKIFTFATGRHYLNALKLLKENNLNFQENDFIVGLNGAQIYSLKTKELIFKKTIKKESLLKLVEFINELNNLYKDNYLVIFYGLDNDIIFYKNNNKNYDELVNDVINFHGEDNNFEIKTIYNLNEINDVFKVTFYIKDKDFKYDYLKSKIMNLSHNEFEITKSTKYLLELMPFNINKAYALDYINQNYYNFDKNEILAFGDSLNDFEMFKIANISITRANADIQLKNIATYVIDADASDFVLDGLELLVD